MRFLSCCTEMRRSVSEKEYGMFQPKGPNSRLSCTTAWKKQSENTSRRKSESVPGPLKKSLSQSGSDRYSLQEKTGTACEERQVQPGMKDRYSLLGKTGTACKERQLHPARKYK